MDVFKHPGSVSDGFVSGLVTGRSNFRTLRGQLICEDRQNGSVRISDGGFDEERRIASLFEMFGAGVRIRTADLLITSGMLLDQVTYCELSN